MNTIEFEAARVAAAFGVEVFTWSFRDDRTYWDDTTDYVGRSAEGCRVSWVFNPEGKLSCVTISEGEEFKQWARLDCLDSEWDVSVSVDEGPVNEMMSKCLYRFGFEHPENFEQLPSLSAHEKFELRFSIPREFWPEAWKREMV